MALLSSDRPGTVTILLAAVRGGSARARDDLAGVVYEELSEMAKGLLGRETPGNRPATAALVNEAYMKLMKFGVKDEDAGAGSGSILNRNAPLSERGGTQTTPDFDNRRHFFGAAAQAMRRILVDAARERDAIKRGGPGGGGARVTLDECDSFLPVPPVEPERLPELEAALNDLERHDPRGAEIVHLRFFAGLSEEQTALVVGLSARQVRRDWQHARAWLFA